MKDWGAAPDPAGGHEAQAAYFADFAGQALLQGCQLVFHDGLEVGLNAGPPAGVRTGHCQYA